MIINKETLQFLKHTRYIPVQHLMYKKLHIWSWSSYMVYLAYMPGTTYNFGVMGRVGLVRGCK